MTEAQADVATTSCEASSPFTFLWSHLTYWICPEFWAVGLFAYFGTGIRTALSEQFKVFDERDPDASYSPVLELFYVQRFLLPNIIGCYVMAVFVANQKNFVENSSPALYKGITTGFCGSVTTLASWLNDADDVLFGRYSWYSIIILIVIEFWISWGAYLWGLASVQLWFEMRERFSSRNEAQGQGESQGYNQVESQGKGESEGEGQGQIQSESQSHMVRNFLTSYEYILWPALFGVATLTFWLIVSIDMHLQFLRSDSQTLILRSIAIGPSGAWIRWTLARIPAIKAMCPTLYPQTLIANVLGVTIDCILSVTAGIDHKDIIWIKAVENGKDT